MSKSVYKYLSAIWKRELQRMSIRPVYFMAPVLVMVFCYVFFLTFMEQGWPNALPAGVVDLDHSALSRTLIRNFDATAQTRIVSHCSSYTEAREQMQQGKIYAFVVIPADFEKNLQASRRPEISFYVNDTYLIPGSLELKDLSYMCQLTGASVQKNVLEARGTVDKDQQMAILQPVALDTHLIANPWANYSVYLVNMLLPGVLQLMIIMMTIFATGMELKERTSPGWVKTANGSIRVALTGKLLPYTILFTLLGIIGNLVLYRFMHFPFNGNLAWMCLATFLYVLANQSIGILFIGLFPVLRDAISLGAFYGLLGFTYAGFTFPIEAMPSGVQIFSWLFPMRHYFLIYGNLALNGTGISYSLPYLLMLFAFIFLPILVINRFKKAAVQLIYSAK